MVDRRITGHTRCKWFAEQQLVKQFLSLLLAMVLLLFFLSFIASAKAQDSPPEITGDAHFDRIINIEHDFYKKSRYDSGLKYSIMALDYAKQKSNDKLLAKAFFYTGACYTFLNKYDSARYFLDKAIAKAAALGNKRLLVQCNNSYAVFYTFQSDNTKAIEYLLKCIGIIEENNDTALNLFLPVIYSNIGYIFDLDKQYEKSIIYHRKAYENKQFSSNNSQVLMIYQNFFLAHLNNGNVLLSKKYLDSAYLLNGHSRGSLQEVYLRNNYGIYYETLKDTLKALYHYLDAYKLCDSISNKYFQATIAINISKLYFGSGNLQKAAAFAKGAYTISTRLKNYSDAVAAFKLAASIEKKANNLTAAFLYLDSFHIYTDSLNAQETRNNILSLESKYNAGQREKEIALLKIANGEKELAVVKRNRMLLVIGIIASALILLLGLLYRTNRQKRLIAEKDQTFKGEQIKFLERQQQVVSLQSMVNGQETERNRIAKDLHDGLGGLFSTIKMQLSTLKHEEKSLETNELFQKSYELVDSASVEVRRIAHNMMPEVLIKLGLIQAIQELCNSINAGKLMRVSMQSYGMEKRLNAATEMMLFRIVQELLNNIIKHAHASEAIIQFNRDGHRLSITVEDNGRGFNLEDSSGKKAGLESVKSRVNYLNGKLAIDSEKEIGTSVLMDFLIDEQ